MFKLFHAEILAV